MNCVLCIKATAVIFQGYSLCINHYLEYTYWYNEHRADYHEIISHFTKWLQPKLEERWNV